MADENLPNRPFPALTTAPRYQFESLGYAIVPGVFTRDECGVMVEALKRCRHDLRGGKIKSIANHGLRPGRVPLVGRTRQTSAP